MRYYKPDYSNCLVNLSCSILHNFNVEVSHTTITEVDDYLNNHQKVVLMLFDGMGKSIVEKHLPPDSFLRKNILKQIDSVFPPTTVAATDALLSGKFPIENGWLGWDSYFKDYDKVIDCFTGVEHDTGALIKPGIMDIYAPYTRIYDQIHLQNKDVFCDSFWPGWNKYNPCKSLTEFGNNINNVLKNNKKCFLYCYWDDPDHSIHMEGTKSLIIKQKVEQINSFIERMVKDNPDTKFLVVADHSLIDVKYISYENLPDFKECLVRNFSIESRASNFFVKEDNKEQFVTLFNKYFGDKFELFSKEEVLNLNIFGEGTPSSFALDELGDFLAISTSEYCLEYGNPESRLAAMHAGGVKEENQIYLFGFKGE